MSAASTASEDISMFDSIQVENKNQYLTFMLAGEEYGVDILRVQEIKGWDNVTKIPNSPSYIKGVMNLRGTIVPIIDLRIRFRLDSLDYNSTTVVIVLKVKSEEKERIMGIVVDAVSDVYDITKEQMKPAPDFGDVISIEFIKGLATVENKMVIVLDIDHLMTSSEMEVISNTSNYSRAIASEKSRQSPSSNIELLENSFSAIAPQANDLARLFYDELFARFPDVKSLFSHLDMNEQQKKLVSALKLVINNLRNPSVLNDALTQLGKRHRQYGADANMYKAVSSTLLDVLKEVMGSRWTYDIQNAWSNALKDISQAMLSAASESN